MCRDLLSFSISHEHRGAFASQSHNSMRKWEVHHIIALILVLISPMRGQATDRNSLFVGYSELLDSHDNGRASSKGQCSLV